MSSSPEPPYHVGQRYSSIQATLQRVIAVTTPRHPHGMRYLFALPEGWHGLYDVPIGSSSRFLAALPMNTMPLRITFTAMTVDLESATVTIGRPVWIPPSETTTP